jgi:hypothetical protein
VSVRTRALWCPASPLSRGPSGRTISRWNGVVRYEQVGDTPGRGASKAAVMDTAGQERQLREWRLGLATVAALALRSYDSLLSGFLVPHKRLHETAQAQCGPHDVCSRRAGGENANAPPSDTSRRRHAATAAPNLACEPSTGACQWISGHKRARHDRQIGINVGSSTGGQRA